MITARVFRCRPGLRAQVAACVWPVACLATFALIGVMLGWRG